MRSIDDAITLGFSPLKINVVVMKGLNDDEILDFVEFTKDKVRMYVQSRTKTYVYYVHVNE